MTEYSGYQKYKADNVKYTTEERLRRNKECLEMVKNREWDKTYIYNSYTGIGGLHGLKYSDYGNYHEFSNAKKDLEFGQFYTPDELCKWIIDCVRPNKTDKIADITCGKGSFFNYLPEESNIYGCEIDENSFKVAGYLFPSAHIQHGDVRSYQPRTLFDIILGNPPFNLDWVYQCREISSQTGFFLKSAEMLYPGGIVAAIVPNAYLRSSTSKSERNTLYDAFDHIVQIALDDKLFSHLSVESFSTKLLILRKKSGSLPEIEFDETVFNISDSQDVYTWFVEKARKDSLYARPAITLEVRKDEVDKNFEIYELNKRLYQIKVHPRSTQFYEDCKNFAYEYLTQKCPPDMLYVAWEEIKITLKQVYAKFSKAFREQNRVEVDKIDIVKGRTHFYYKGYSKSTELLAHEKNIREGTIPIHQAVTGDFPLSAWCGKYRKLILKKRRQFKNQTTYFSDMEPDPTVAEWLSNWKLTNKWGNKTIKLGELQLRDTALALSKPYAYLQWEQGGGKTISGIAQGQYRMENGLANYTFVISSAISIEMTWAPILAEFDIPHKVIRNRRDFHMVFPGDFILITIGRVKNSKRWLKPLIKRARKRIFVIYDEAHNSSSFSENENEGKITKGIFSMFHRLRQKLLMSGTSISNNVLEVFAQLQLLYNSSYNMLSLCETTYKYSAKNDWYTESDNPYYGLPYPPYVKGFKLFRSCHLPKKLTVFGVVKTTPDIFNATELRHIISYTMITRTFEEITGKKIANISEIPCEMNRPEKEIYEIAQKEFYRLEALYFSSKNVSERYKAQSRIIAQIKIMLRICACAKLFPDYSGDGLTGKMKTIFDMISMRQDERIAIGLRETKHVYAYAAAARKMFPDRKVFTITGSELTPRQRKYLIDNEFSQHDNFILVCTQQSLSESVSIDAVDCCFIAELHWNESKMAQFYRRFIRYVSTRQKHIYYVNYPDSIETNLIYLLVSKERMLRFLKGADISFQDLFDDMGFKLSLHEHVMVKNQTEKGAELDWGKAEIRDSVDMKTA